MKGLLRYIRNIYQYYRVPYYKRLYNELKDAKDILDLGCGQESCLSHINIKAYTVGVEASKKCYQIALRDKTHKKLINANLMDYIRKNRQHYEVILLSDIVEHLTKKQAAEVINNAKKWANKIVLFTPKGYLEQVDEGNDYNSHKSGWEAEDLTKLGFNAKIVQNFNIKSIYAIWQR